MQEKRYKELHLDQLLELQTQATQSRIWVNPDEKKLYKIFNEMEYTRRQRKTKKIEIFSQIKEPYLINADCILRERNKLKGYESKYIESAKTIKSLKKYQTLKSILSIVYDISKDLQTFHNLEGHPIMSDVNFNNFIIDENQNHYFVDHDSYGIDNLLPDEIANSLASYLNRRYYDLYNEKITQETDKITFLLELFLLIIPYNLSDISMYTYDQYAEKYKVLRQLKEIFIELRKPSNRLPNIPYFHEIITEVEKKEKTKKKR